MKCNFEEMNRAARRAALAGMSAVFLTGVSACGKPDSREVEESVKIETTVETQPLVEETSKVKETETTKPKETIEETQETKEEVSIYNCNSFEYISNELAIKLANRHGDEIKYFKRHGEENPVSITIEEFIKLAKDNENTCATGTTEPPELEVTLKVEKETEEAEKIKLQEEIDKRIAQEEEQKRLAKEAEQQRILAEAIKAQQEAAAKASLTPNIGDTKQVNGHTWEYQKTPTGNMWIDLDASDEDVGTQVEELEFDDEAQAKATQQQIQQAQQRAKQSGNTGKMHIEKSLEERLANTGHTMDEMTKNAGKGVISEDPNAWE